MCTRHEMLVLRLSGGLRMSPALMSPRSSWHSVCIVIVASIAQCRHSQTLRIRSQSCQRQSKLPRLPTTNESEREQAPTNRKSCKRAVGCKRHSQRDVEAKLVHHRSFELHAESIEDLHIDREWSSVQTLCADRCVSKCVCVCVTLSNCIITSKENPQSPYAGHRLFPNCNDAGAVVQTANRQIKE